jgi:hypothetical protein
MMGTSVVQASGLRKACPGHASWVEALSSLHKRVTGMMNLVDDPAVEGRRSWDGQG